MASRRTDSSIAEQTAASQYIVEFYQKIQKLNEFYAVYKSISIELGSFQELNDEQKQSIINMIHNVRNVTEQTYIMCISIFSSIEKDDKTIKSFEKDLDAHISKMNNAFIIDYQDLQKYVIEVNKFLLKSVIKQLLENSTEITSKLIGIYNK